MEVKLAERMGFCFGVKRAVNLVSAETEKSGEGIYTYGPIIHNEEVVRAFEEKGVRVVLPDFFPQRRQRLKNFGFSVKYHISYSFLFRSGLVRFRSRLLFLPYYTTSSCGLSIGIFTGKKRMFCLKLP